MLVVGLIVVVCLCVVVEVDVSCCRLVVVDAMAE